MHPQSTLHHSCSENHSQPFALKKSVRAMSGLLVATLAAVGAHAQETSNKAESDIDILEEVVVTGTHIRGIQPTGSNSIGVDQEAILEIGAASATDVLASIPQADNLFMGRATLDPQALSQNTIIKPNLRGLPGVTTASGSTTLLLVDGHRIVGMGVKNASPDPDIVPPAILERVEVITDGGSSLYGADAVGGVINFITKKDFEGVQIDLNYGAGDAYSTYDASITAGTTWENGSGYLSFTNAEQDSLVGGDRDWAPKYVWDENGPRNFDTECNAPVGSTQNYTATDFGFLPFTIWREDGAPSFIGEPCNHSLQDSLVPETERNAFFFGLSQRLNDAVELDVKGFLSKKDSTFESYPRGGSVSFGPMQNDQTGGAPNGAMTTGGSVGFSFMPHSAYSHKDTEVNIEAWGLTPTLTIDLDSGWQLRSMVHYSESQNERRAPGVNRPLLNTLADSGDIDPTDIASADPADINALLDWETHEESEQELFITRMIADGAVFELPAGEVRTAIGFEFMDETARLRQGSGVVGFLNGEDFPEAKRDVKSFFAEVHIPLLSGAPGAESLVLSASARYDEYSDFGSTTNPQVTLTWEPVDWVTVYASYGESFNAPTLIDTLQGLNALGTVNADTALFGALGILAAEQGQDIGFLTGKDSVGLRGANPGLDPQTAETKALGLALAPVDGLHISMNYYEIEFTNLLSTPNPTSIDSMRANAAAVRYSSPTNPITQAELEDFLGQSFNGEDILAQIADVSEVGTLIDLRLSNGNEAMLRGLDFNINYQHDTGLGTLQYGIAGTHPLEFRQGPTGSDLRNSLLTNPEYLWTAHIALQKNNIRAKLAWQHTDSSGASSALDSGGEPLQTSVDDYDIFNLFVGYDFAGSGMTEGLSVRFNVDNLLDEDPPIHRQDSVIPANGFSLGRVFKVGLTKRFF